MCPGARSVVNSLVCRTTVVFWAEWKRGCVRDYFQGGGGTSSLFGKGL